MNEEYDAIVCGTGLKECVLSGLLASKGKKVLHVDRNSYYGGESASLNLTNLWNLYRPGVEPPQQYGHNRDWNVDLIPKFIMANGKLVKMLLHTTVTKYLEWKCVDASFVYQITKGGMFSKSKAVIKKVPGNDSEALKSDLMGLFEKKRCRNFFIYVQNFSETDKKTWKDFDPFQQNMIALYKKFSLEENTIDFLGHAVAMQRDDKYLVRPAIEFIRICQLYVESMGKYGDSPFLYPIYGLGGIPEGFSRYCAIHGGTYMLNTPVDEILFDENGMVTGIKSPEGEARAPIVICDPSYALQYERVKTN
jgi:Rab GDP dissociation inhibitor